MKSILLIACLLAATSVHSELVLHYTFDNADRDGRTLFDTVGAADATAVGAVGLGALGEIEQAVWFPNDDGQSYVELPAAQNPMPSGSDARTIAFWFNQLQVGDENKLFGYGSGAAGRSFDLSLEAGGVRLRYSGGNVTWGSGFDFTGAEAGYQHVAVRVNENANDFLDLDVLLNGSPLVGVATGGSPGSTPINTGGGAATTLNLGRSPVFEPQGDFIGLLDDFRVYDQALSNAEIAALAGPPDTLVVDIDPVTGAVSLRNSTDEAIPLDYYELTSPSGSLNTTGWVSLESQNRNGFNAGTGQGDGWEELGTATDERLAEGRLLGGSEIAAGESLPIGNAFATSGQLDLQVTYRSFGEFQNGRLGEASVGQPGDFNDDGLVNAADYTAWHDASGLAIVLPNDPTPGVLSNADRTLWASNYGGEALLSIALPTPSGGALLALTALCVYLPRRAVFRSAA